MSNNKVKVSVCGVTFSIQTGEQDSYVIKLAETLERDIKALFSETSGVSLTNTAILCAISYLDKYKKSEKSTSNMRNQIKEYLSEAANSKLMYDEERKRSAILESQLGKTKNQLDSLSRSGNADDVLRAKIAELETSMAELETEKANIEEENLTLNERINALNDYIVSRDKELDNLKMLGENQAQQIEYLEKSLESRGQEIMKFSESIKILEEMIEAESSGKTIEAENKMLEAQRKMAEAEKRAQVAEDLVSFYRKKETKPELYSQLSNEDENDSLNTDDKKDQDKNLKQDEISKEVEATQKNSDIEQAEKIDDAKKTQEAQTEQQEKGEAPNIFEEFKSPPANEPTNQEETKGEATKQFEKPPSQNRNVNKGDEITPEPLTLEQLSPELDFDITVGFDEADETDFVPIVIPPRKEIPLKRNSNETDELDMTSYLGDMVEDISTRTLDKQTINEGNASVTSDSNNPSIADGSKKNNEPVQKFEQTTFGQTPKPHDFVSGQIAEPSPQQQNATPQNKQQQPMFQNNMPRETSLGYSPANITVEDAPQQSSMQPPVQQFQPIQMGQPLQPQTTPPHSQPLVAQMSQNTNNPQPIPNEIPPSRQRQRRGNTKEIRKVDKPKDPDITEIFANLGNVNPEEFDDFFGTETLPDGPLQHQDMGFQDTDAFSKIVNHSGSPTKELFDTQAVNKKLQQGETGQMPDLGWTEDVLN